MVLKPVKSKKLDYSAKKYKHNPLFRKKSKPLRRGLSLKLKVILFFFIILIGASAWFLFYSGYFTIQSVEIKAEGSANPDEVRAKINDQLGADKYYIFKNNNILTFSKSEAYKKLNDFYNFETLIIDKNYPNGLTVSYKTRKQAFVWSEGGILYYIDEKGTIIGETNPADQAIKNFFLIENQSTHKLVDKQIENIQDIEIFIFSINKSIGDKMLDYLKIEKFILDNNLNAIKMKLANGPAILLNVNGNVDNQLNKLDTLVKEKLKADFNKKQYIDIRFGDMIYYQ